MSAIPKIKISSSRDKETINLNTLSQTTTNFGCVQPVFCREMMPNSKFTIKVGSKVFMQPMPKPTFGSVYLDLKHVFVPYRDICPQFDSFLASQPYTPAMGSSYVPTSLPYANFGLIAQNILARYADWSAYKVTYATGSSTNPTYSLVEATQANSTELAEVKQLWNMVTTPAAANIIWGSLGNSNNAVIHYMPSLGSNLRSLADDSEGVLLLGDYYVAVSNNVPSSHANFAFDTTGVGVNYIRRTNYYDTVSIDGADFLSTFNINGTAEYLLAFRLKPYGKRLRNILLGLGYPFNPHSLIDFNLLKLLAFYKSWFALYRPNREYSFTMTNCYALVKKLQDPLYVNVNPTDSTLYNFIGDLAIDCYAYLPQDYYGMSVRIPGQNYQGVSDTLQTNQSSYIASNGTNNINTNLGRATMNQSTTGAQVISVTSATGSSATIYPMAQELATKVLRYVNKNTIVGRNIHDFVKAHFGVSIDDSHDLDSVYLIGDSSVDVNISDVFSSASTTDAHLGQLGGLGVGQSAANESFYYENKDNFGIWISLMCIMPKSGYCQGYLRENRQLSKLDFPTPEFDAAGYQLLERGEISSDYPVSLPDWSARSNVDLEKGFGFVPRYSHTKVSKNIVSGDLSLRGYRNNMAAYTLERLLPYDSDRVTVVSGVRQIFPAAPRFLPTVVFDDFRKIDPTDTLGNYNRVFFEQSNQEDHFIVSQGFVVEAEMPLMSLSDSFDTFDNDGKVVEIKHS